jgi:hypothetical protein
MKHQWVKKVYQMDDVIRGTLFVSLANVGNAYIGRLTFFKSKEQPSIVIPDVQESFCSARRRNFLVSWQLGDVSELQASTVDLYRNQELVGRFVPRNSDDFYDQDVDIISEKKKKKIDYELRIL